MNQTGQNISCPTRPCQNPLPSLKPPIRKICRQLVRGDNGYERHIPRRWHTRTLPRAFCNLTTNFPLRSHQVPGLRADPLRYHPLPRTRNTNPKVVEREFGRRNKRLLHLSLGSNPCPSSLRNKTRLPLLPVRNLQADLQRSSSTTSPSLWSSRPCCNDRSSESCCSKSRLGEFLQRILGDDDGHVALCWDVLPHARYGG